MKEIYITDTVVIYNDMEKGWSQGKYQPRWHKKVYMMWWRMWRRVYGEVHWFGSLIHPSFKYLSNYVKWVEAQPRFDEFCKTCDITHWSVDKDLKYVGNKNYYPEYMSLMLLSENVSESINRNGTPKPKQSVLGIPLDNANKIIITLTMKDVTNYGFNPGGVSSCARKKIKSHKGYKWYKLNYKHNKHFRVK